MPSELERLDEILSTQYKQNEYISRDGLRHAIRTARDSAGPATEQYPLMMYLDGNREQYITVADAEKEAEAAGPGLHPRSRSAVCGRLSATVGGT